MAANFQDVLRDVHDPSTHTLKTSGSAAANQVTVSILGNVTLNSSPNYIGLVSISGSVGVSAGVAGIGFVTANVAEIASGSNYIGLISVSGSVVNLTGTNNIGSVSILGGSLGLNSGTNSVGFATVQVASIAAGINYIGFATVQVASIAAGINYIGFATVNNVSQPALVASSANIGSVSVLGGGIGINSGVNNIGFTTTYNGTSWPDPKTYIGLVTVGHTVTVAAHALSAGVAGIGFTTVNVAAIAAGANYIGLVSTSGSTVNLAGTNNIGSVSVLGGLINIRGNLTLADSRTYIGLNTVTAGVGDRFIGLVTAWVRNAGSAKTLITIPFTLSTGSVSTLAVPSTNQVIYPTNLILSSDATVRVSFKSGVTYLTGNASIGITLNPGGGFVESGSPDSPTYIGLPSGAWVLEKFDMTGTKANIGGKITYFTE